MGNFMGGVYCLIGGLIMTHSDDFGLVLPPKLPIQVVIVPIYKGEEQLKVIAEHADVIVKALKDKGISVNFDDRDTFRPEQNLLNMN